DLVHLITAGMTFLEQQEVVASVLVEISPGDTIASFTSTELFRRPMLASTPRHTFGDRILSDKWWPDSRPLFLETFLQRFRREKKDDALRQAFFRCIEISRLATPFVDIHHFLAFSALELLSRSLGV